MNIKQFNVRDIITRNEAAIYGNNVKDGSYTGSKMMFLGLDDKSKLILLSEMDGIFSEDNIMKLSYANASWDEGWCYYPTVLFSEAEKIIKSQNNHVTE